MFAERLEAILESWKKSFGQYGRQRAQAEQAVVRWEWTTGERYSDLPFHFERFPGRGRVVFCACFKLNGYTPRYGRKRKDPDGLYQWLDYNGRFKTAEEYINARYEIFSPIIEDEWFFEIDDPKTLEMCQILDQEIRAGEQWDTATSILRDVAARLTRQDWSNILNITQDFVVFALDPEMEGDHIVEILSSSASKEQIQDWKDKGWLV